jgi:hypothetical protein
LHPAAEGEKREGNGVQNQGKSFRNKRKKGFGKAKKVSTFADPNGGLLYEAEEVRKAKAILADKK